MIGFRPNRFYVFCWLVAAPVVILGMLLFYLIEHEPLTYSDTYVYPWWGEAIGWCMALASIIWIPLYALYFLCSTPGTFLEVNVIPLTNIGLFAQLSSHLVIILTRFKCPNKTIIISFFLNIVNCD